MYLLNTKTLALELFINEAHRPPYAILSHTWLQAGEVTFDDIQDLTKARQKPGFSKIESTCRRALQDNLEYAWVDTCCIDKSSSSELTEAINSMYRWYKDSKVCYAYLADVTDVPLADIILVDGIEQCNEALSTNLDTAEQACAAERFLSSRWFKRGWTLQELLAPGKLLFFGPNWHLLGSMLPLVSLVSRVTRIPVRTLLKENELHEVSVAKRMSWVSDRETTKIEDEAYCLLGIFNVNMALIYGEGAKAFRRLQELIASSSNDQSILAWRRTITKTARPRFDQPIFAPSVAAFGDCGHIERLPAVVGSSLSFASNAGLNISMRVAGGAWGSTCARIALLDCYDSRAIEWRIALPLTPPTFADSRNRQFYIVDRILIDESLSAQAAHTQDVTLLDAGVEASFESRIYLRLNQRRTWFAASTVEDLSLKLDRVFPLSAWDEASMSLTTKPRTKTACVISVNRSLPDNGAGVCRTQSLAFRVVLTHDVFWNVHTDSGTPSDTPLETFVWVSADDGRDLAQLCRSDYDLQMLDKHMAKVGSDTDDLCVIVDVPVGTGPQLMTISLIKVTPFFLPLFLFTTFMSIGASLISSIGPLSVWVWYNVILHPRKRLAEWRLHLHGGIPDFMFLPVGTERSPSIGDQLDKIAQSKIPHVVRSDITEWKGGAWKRLVELYRASSVDTSEFVLDLMAGPSTRIGNADG